jgi:hypothetical protein
MEKIEKCSIFEFQIQNTNTRQDAEYIVLTRQSQARAILRATAGVVSSFCYFCHS